MTPIINYSNDDVIKELKLCGFEAAIIFRQENIIDFFISRDFLEVLALIQEQQKINEMTFEYYDRFFEIYTYNWFLRTDDENRPPPRNVSVLNERQMERLQTNLIERFDFEEIQPAIINFFRNSDAQYAYLWADINNSQYSNQMRIESWNNQVCIPEIVPGIHQFFSEKSS